MAAATNTAGAKFQTGSTALHLAAASGRADCVRLLLAVGADKEAQNKVCIMHGTKIHLDIGLYCKHTGECLRRLCVLVSCLLACLSLSV